MLKVVHVNKEYFDVYIGRGNCPNTGRPSKWGNPFTHIKDKTTLAEHVVTTRDEALTKYHEYLINNKELMDKIEELDGKTLGCWCITDSNNPPFPYICHGQILNEVITKFNILKLSF